MGVNWAHLRLMLCAPCGGWLPVPPLKVAWSRAQGREVSAVQAAACGSAAGAFAAGVTTPLDVIKTRLMLGSDSKGKR